MAKRLTMARTRVLDAPFYDPERDGVSQSLLNTFRYCREAARTSLEGWRGKYPSFPLVYGGISHFVLDRAYSARLDRGVTTIPDTRAINQWLEDARQLWKEENPHPSDLSVQIFEESSMKLAAILPQYFRYWRSDFTSREWVGLEREFKIPWTVLASNGRTYKTFLRGKIDGLFRTPRAKKNPKALRLFETKNRAQIDEEKLIDTMPMDLQTRFYSIAAQELLGEPPIEVELNIIRKTGLRQGKKETPADYERRIIADVKERLDWYFVRMNMSITKADLRLWLKEVNALIGDFLMWWYGVAAHYPNDLSCYVYGRPCDFLKKCSHNDTSQLFLRDRVFSELEADNG